jgi:hypothetical protein
LSFTDVHPHKGHDWVADNRDLESSAMEIEAQAQEQEPIEEYVPGVANGRNYMARLCHLHNGPWYIDVIHVESLAPLHNSNSGNNRTWLTRDEAIQAADKLVASLAH